MFRFIPRATLLVFSLLFLVPARSRAQEPKAAATARLLMNVIDVVQEKHIEPPTRQEMVLQTLRHLAEKQQKVSPPGLSRRISSADPADLEPLLARELSVYLQDSEPSTRIPALPYEIFEFLTANHINVLSQQDHRVQEQVEGNRYVGIGVAVSTYQPTQQLQILRVERGGAADKAGLRKDDVVESVDGKPTGGKSLAEIIKMLRGEEGTDVTVTVRQPKEKQLREYTMTRGIVPFQTVKEPKYSGNDRVAAIGFQRFSGSTVHELRKMEAELPETVEMVTLDFRSLSGRNLHHGILIANALLDGKPIGQVETTEGVRTVTAEPGTLFGDRKLLILIDPSTQGTPLWIAAAVKAAGGDHEVIGKFQSDGLVFDAVPLPGTDLVVTMPTARLRRFDGQPLSVRHEAPTTAVPLPRIPVKRFEREALFPGSNPPDLNRLKSVSLQDLAEELARWLPEVQNSEDSKD